MPDNQLALNACLNLGDVKRILWGAAYSQSLHQHIVIRNVKISGPILDSAILGLEVEAARWLGPLSHVAGNAMRWKLTVAAEDHTYDGNGQKVIDDQALALYEQSLNHFKWFATSRRGGASAYVEEQRQKARQNYLAIQAKYSAAQQFNDSVIQALDIARDNVYRVKVAADIAFLVIGTVVPVGWAANAAIGVGYGLTCRLASSLAEAGTSDMSSYVADPTSDPTKNSAVGDASATLAGKGGDLIDKYVEGTDPAKRAMEVNKKIAERQFEQQLRAKAEEAGLKLAKEFDRLQTNPTAIERAMMKNGFQPQSLSRAAQVVIKEERNVAAALKLVKAPPVPASSAWQIGGKSGVQVIRETSTLGGKALAVGGRAGGIAVGILFMWDDIKVAFEGLSAHEERERRERAEKIARAR